MTLTLRSYIEVISILSTYYVQALSRGDRAEDQTDGPYPSWGLQSMFLKETLSK